VDRQTIDLDVPAPHECPQARAESSSSTFIQTRRTSLAP
jgi:hypothetical protein